MLPIPPTAYIIAAALVLGLGLGSGATYKIQRGNVLALELAIATANSQADVVTSIAKEKVAKAENKAVLANLNLDQAHDSSIKTINTYRDMLATERLRDPNKKHCTNTLPTGSDSKVDSANADDGAYISTEFSRLLWSEAKRADACAVDKATLLEFVKGNCGIAP